MRSVLRSRRIRWAAPVVVFGVIALVAALPSMSAGAATPALPPMTPQALIAKAQTAHVEGLSGTVRLSANLGIPDLSTVTGALGQGSGGFNPASLLSGLHSAQVWASEDGFKATYSDSLTTEDDVIVNHTDLWTWQSQGTKVTHVVLPPHESNGKAAPAPAAKQPSSPRANSPVKTPDQVAQAVLDLVGPSTNVSVAGPTRVAGRPAYELALSPKANTPSAASTLRQITVAVDSATGLPVRVRLFANGQADAALDFGFSSLKIGVPAASTFRFTPPPGAHVTTSVANPRNGGARAAQGGPMQPGSGSAPAGGGNQPAVVGQDWATVAIFRNVQLPWQADRVLFRGSTAAPAAAGQPTGRLFHTALVNVLMLDNGNVAVGAVNPAALETAAAQAG